MFGLSDITGILNLLEKFLTFGRSEITGVQEETEELIRDISRSLVSLHDVVTDAYSGAKLPPIPFYCYHRFRCIVTTHSGTL